jgi:predicted small lipoprotein YifL
MRRLPTLIALLVTTLSIAACGGSGPQQSGQAPPQETQAETQATPATQSAPREKNAPEESAPSEGAQEESAQGGGEAAALSVTTMEGEQVAVGGQGEVTALYFMAGW